MDRTEFEENVLKKCKTQGLVISRIPKSTREEFVKFAEDYYADDYGMALLELWNNYKRSQFLEVTFFSNIDLKLNELLNRNVPKREEEKPKKEIKFLDGRKARIEKEVKHE